ncbi:MAG: Unknown protein [uncultured Campylobacterales bacterium]|uniref:Porin domain-containing protein n=1 Tax=uncultured Campylobacterales bacterium TaxID=352960 RepID=A0A6S6SZK9_9BACT|nr:MAG: Unknown protein [uncultured Campylobacterales bacterium]
MKFKNTLVLGALTSTLLFGNSLEQKVAELESKIEALTEQSAFGAGESKLSFNGYAKVDYVNYLDRRGEDFSDDYRLILAPKYKFSDTVSFISEIEFEHAGSTVEVEQSYIEWKVQDNLSLNIGKQIVPMGYVNLYHEPTVFNGVNRPETEKNIVPSTWYENAILVKGNYDKLKFQAGILPSLDATEGSSVRDWRGKGNKAKAEDIAVVARVDYTFTPEFQAGFSYFMGDIGQNAVGLEDAKISMLNIYATYQIEDLKVKAFYAQNDIDGITGLSETKPDGYYIDASYKIDDFVPFVRYEEYQVETKADSRTLTTLGLNYFINPNVVLKADYIFYEKSDGEDDDRFSMGVGMMF